MADHLRLSRTGTGSELAGALQCLVLRLPEAEPIVRLFERDLAAVWTITIQHDGRGLTIAIEPELA